jgi:hypothetical protein
MSNFKIAAIPITMLEYVWKDVEKELQRAVDTAHGEATIESVKRNLLSGDVLLLTVIDEDNKIIATLTMEIRVMESGLRCLVFPMIGGHRAHEWVDQFLNVAKNLAIEYNCSELRGFATRKGWMRMLEPKGFKEAHVVMTCQLDELKTGE